MEHKITTEWLLERLASNGSWPAGAAELENDRPEPDKAWKTRLPSIFMVPRPLRQLKLATTRACYPLEGRGPYSRPGILQSEQTLRAEQRATNSNS